MFDIKLKDALDKRQQQHLLRQRVLTERADASRLWVNGKEYLNFSGNDYLGIASDCQLTGEQNRTSGASASPLVTGYSSIHQELEAAILDWVGAPKDAGCLLFSSGFSANNAVINSLFTASSSPQYLIQDKLNHASLMDAGKHIQALGYGRQYRFEHNNLEKLQSILNGKTDLNNKGTVQRLIVTEGVFSMDGDSPDLDKLNAIAKSFHSWWMLDDAHGIGVLGKNGAGTLSQQGLNLSDCDLLVITFGKAIGAQGAAVIANKTTIEYLINFSREYVYSTHLSPIQAQCVLNNIQQIQTQGWRREKLNHNIQYFKNAVAKTPYTLLNSESAIQPIIIGDEVKTLTLSNKLKAKGIWVGAMRYPTVAKGKARLRVTISTKHTNQDIDYLVDCLTNSDVSQ